MILVRLLQISEEAAVSLAAIDQSVNIIEIAISGGIFMIPILILFIVSTYLFIERMLTYNRADKDPQPFIDKIKEFVLEGDLNGAKLLCSQNETPFARMIEKGLAKIGSPIKNIEAAIENIGKTEVYNLEHNLNGMATVSKSAPMLGFLGAVIGMIQVFITFSQQAGLVDTKLLLCGVYEAMITIVAGLLVGILAYFMYIFLVSRVQKITHKMEHATFEFLDLLQETK